MSGYELSIEGKTTFLNPYPLSPFTHLLIDFEKQFKHSGVKKYHQKRYQTPNSSLVGREIV